MPGGPEVASGASEGIAPIFIMGITQRSGTNFLFNLLGLHPDCQAVGPIWENYLLTHAELLIRYAEAVYGVWPEDWRVAERLGPPDSLLQDLGVGLVRFLNRQLTLGGEVASGEDALGRRNAAGRLVTKTPSVEGLQCFRRIFPRAPLLIVTRDGRAVTESSVRSFGWSYESAMRQWARGARQVLEFLEDQADCRGDYLIVKYEDLCADCERALRRILVYADLAADAYDFDAARNLPVSGSCELIAQGATKIHWRPAPKSSEFNPLQRFSDWRRARYERFNWVAGEYQVKLGYSRRLGPSRRWRWAVWNCLLDAWRLAWLSPSRRSKRRKQAE